MALPGLPEIGWWFIPNDVQCVAILKNYKTSARMSSALTITRIDLYGLHTNIWQHFKNIPGDPSNDSVKYVIVKERVVQNKINRMGWGLLLENEQFSSDFREWDRRSVKRHRVEEDRWCCM
ncbi:hypothetical protein FXO37_25850 [Capsicum annuum]|nr:hypothetical protein FXO37_25850 [Capsicum annuum]